MANRIIFFNQRYTARHLKLSNTYFWSS